MRTEEQINDELICTSCALEEDTKAVDPRSRVVWGIGHCKMCRKQKYITERKNYKSKEE